MNKEKDLLLKDLCARISCGVICDISLKKPATLQKIFVDKLDGIILDFYDDGNDYRVYLGEVRPYLRTTSSMTEEEKKDLLLAIVGNKGINYFRVLEDGSVSNTDLEIQDLDNLSIHWINFDKDTVTRYIDWLNEHHFDYRGLIERGLALEAPKDMYKFGGTNKVSSN